MLLLEGSSGVVVREVGDSAKREDSYVTVQVGHGATLFSSTETRLWLWDLATGAPVSSYAKQYGLPISMKDLLGRTSFATLQLVGDSHAAVRSVAIACGSGGELLLPAIRGGPVSRPRC